MNELASVFQASGGVGGWALAIVLLITVVKVWPKLKELQVGSDGSLRQDLMAEIVRLRADNAEERTQHDKRIDELVRDHRIQLAEFEKQIRELQAEIRQIVASQARAMNAQITEHLSRAFPLPAELPDEMKGIVENLEDDDAGK